MNGDTATVYVEGISYNAGEEDVDAFFRACGAILEIRLPRWHDSGKPRGYAHVEFAQQQSAAAALASPAARVEAIAAPGLDFLN